MKKTYQKPSCYAIGIDYPQMVASSDRDANTPEGSQTVTPITETDPSNPVIPTAPPFTTGGDSYPEE